MPHNLRVSSWRKWQKHEGDSHVVATVRESREKNAATQLGLPFPQTSLEVVTGVIHRHS